MPTPVLVAGSGSWGTALALVLARNGHDVQLWGIDKEEIQAIHENGSNEPYLPGVKFPDNLTATNDLQKCLDECSDIVLSVPCLGLKGVLETIKQQGKQYKLCITCKGLQPETKELNHQLVEDILGDSENTVVLSGPSFAKEVAKGLPTAVTIAGTNQETTNHFAEKFHNDVFRTYTHDDLVSVQVGGAVKNVMAIAAGIADGLGFGANTRAALITRGLTEIIRLGVALGGKQETFMGLTGLGDLVLTCTDDQSRNRRFGLALAKGASVAEASEEIGQAIEGMKTCNEVYQLAQELNIEMPITEQVCKVIDGEISPDAAVKALLMREQKQEID